MNFIAKPKTIEEAIRRTRSEIRNIDQAWGKGPSRLAGMGLDLDDREEAKKASTRLQELEKILQRSKFFYGS